MTKIVAKLCFNPKEQIQNGMIQASECPLGQVLAYNVMFGFWICIRGGICEAGGHSTVNVTPQDRIFSTVKAPLTSVTLSPKYEWSWFILEPFTCKKIFICQTIENKIQKLRNYVSPVIFNPHWASETVEKAFFPTPLPVLGPCLRESINPK